MSILTKVAILLVLFLAFLMPIFLIEYLRRRGHISNLIAQITDILSGAIFVALFASLTAPLNVSVTGGFFPPLDAYLDDLFGSQNVKLFYATNRMATANTNAVSFGGDRARQITYGTVTVSVPKNHRVGYVERPWSLHLFSIYINLREDPAEHFMLRSTATLTKQDFFQTMTRALHTSSFGPRQVFIFIHGYNTSFEEASFRVAQIAYDMQFDGVPILYSWPSRASTLDYEYDQNSAMQTRPFLREFIDEVRDRSGAEIIHLIAHSMGNAPLIEVLASLADGAKDKTAADAPMFNQVIMAAPDIDVDVFRSLADKIKSVAKGVTLYASSADKAMRVSRTYARGVPRAGDVPEAGPAVVDGIDTIDASALSFGVFSLNHSGYAESRILLDDMGMLLRLGLRPPSARHATMRKVDTEEGPYWIFPR